MKTKILFFITSIFLFFNFHENTYGNSDNFPLKEKLQKIKEQGLLFLEKDTSEGAFKIDFCPLAASSDLDIFQKLDKIRSDLKYTKCEQERPELMQSFSNLVKYLDANAGKPNTYEGQISIHQAQAAMDILSSIAANPNCALDFRSRGIIPVVTDVITGLSQMAMVGALSFPAASTGTMPTTSWIIGGAAGSYVVSSGIKILYNIFKSRFDWFKFEDRQQFLQLVCAFYRTRIDLNTAHFFRIKNNLDMNLLNEATLLNKDIEAQLKILEEEENKILEKEMGGKGNKDFHGNMDTLIKELSFPSHFDEKMSEVEILSIKNNFKRTIPDTLKRIRLYLENSNLNYDDFPLLSIKDDMNYLYDETTLSSLKGKSETEISHSLLQPLMEIKSALDLLYEKSKNKAEAPYKDDKESLLGINKGVKDRILIYTKIVDKKNYVSSDEGSSIRQSIIKTYNDIVDLIIEKNGWDFLYNTNKQARASINEFLRSYELFQNFSNRIALVSGINYVEANKNLIPSDIILPRIQLVCSSSLKMLRDFSHAEALLDMASDFLDTNRDLLNGAEPFYTTFLGIPYKRSSSAKLIVQDMALIKEKEKMKNENFHLDILHYLESNDFRTVPWSWNGPLIGELMDILEKNRSRVQGLQGILEENSCNKILHL